MSYEDLNLEAAAALRGDTDPRNHLMTTDVPPARFLSKPTQKLLTARDEAWNRYSDFEADNYDVLSSDWERTASAKDEAAAKVAAAEGRDVFDLPSAVDEARSRRPKALGALKALADRVRATDAALVSAVRRELPAIQERIEADVQTAAAEYVEAQNRADAARQRYGSALLGRSWATDWAVLGLRPPFRDQPEATPVDASGHEVQDVYGRPIPRGAAEVKAIDESYGRVTPRLTATIRSTVNDQVLTIDASHAQALVDKGQAEFVSAD